MLRQIVLSIATGFVLFLLLNTHQVFAANATMSIAPHFGSYGNQFSVRLVIDGHGEKFNAAQATVSLSYGLAIKDLVLGDCNLSFLKMPSIQDPSFAGIIPSTYSTKCTVYTLKLVPTAKTNATIALIKTQVRRYGDAANILSASTGGSYTLTNTMKSPETSTSQPPASSQNGLYTVNINVLSGEATVSNATVILNSVSDNKQQQAITDQTGHATIKDLQPGIYDAVVTQNNTKVAETIINLSGHNHILNFSININAQKNNPMLKTSGAVLGLSTSSPYLIAAILVIGVIIGTALTFILLKIRNKRSFPA